MQIKRTQVVRLTAGILGVLTCVDFLLSLVVAFNFNEQAEQQLASHVGLMIFTTIITGLTCFYLLGETLYHLVIKHKQKLPKSLAAFTWKSAPRRGNWKIFIQILVLFLNVFALITTLFSFINAPFLIWISSDGEGSYLGPTVALKCLESIGLGLQVLFVSSLVVALWWPYVMLTGCLIAVFSTLQFLITIISVLINYAVMLSEFGHLRHKTPQIYICLSIFLAIAAFLGFNLILFVRAHNRLSVQTTRLVRFYMAISILSTILCLVWFIHGVVLLAHYASISRYQDGLIANPILAGAGFLIDIFTIICAVRMRHTPQTQLEVEEYNLNSLSLEELQAWARLIDAYNAKMSPDIPKGANAIELMMAYVNSPMNGFSCKVLRVYDPKTAETAENEIKENTSQARKRKSYGNVHAWNQLDRVHPFNENTTDDSSGVTLTGKPDNKKGGAAGPAGGNKEKPMSKNALKKAQKKAAKKNKPLDLPVFDKEERSPEQIARENAFRADLLATEALFLLTTIENYDLTSPIQVKWAHTILQRLLGSRSWFKPLCVRMGIVGTHWPFRQMMFFTAPTKKPIARTAAVLAAISSWNDNLKRTEKCTIILNPCYRNTENEAALEMSNWIVTKMLPSHVIDLRPYKGKSITEYLKAIKYRNQATVFTQAKGQVLETNNFSLSNCTAAMDLWHNIADKRTSDGHTAVLHEPDVDFLHSLGAEGHNPRQWRKLLFLKVDGEIIASCVLFFLGNTITSDIQGLEHEKARHYKAYFVMMQETITIALRENISFVDFGPTTAKPKKDIGAAEIPIMGGIRALAPFSPFVSLFANQVNGD